ncbi:PAS domain-containing protein, partial [Oceanithermus sp.]|uniref:PAS domain-containing protein n=1 Tax=Oceanithermus sp. TaxID=2268145 RepID=UPI0025E202D7
MPERGWGVQGMNPWLSRLRRLGWRLRRRLPFPLKFTAREWRTLLERLPVVVYQALADEQGSTIFAAGAVEEVLGYTPLEWTARPGAWYEALHPDDRRRVMRRLRR